MRENNLFTKYILKSKKEDIFHSSTYGKAQNGDRIGSASTEGFEKRMEIENNRQVVHSYSDSRIANEALANGPKAKKYTPPETKIEGVNKAKNNDAMVVKKNISSPIPSVKKTFTSGIKPNFGK